MDLGVHSRRLVAVVGLSTCLAMAGCGVSTASAPTRAPSSAAAHAPSAPAPAPTASAVAADSMTVVTRAEAGAALGQSVRAAVSGKATVEGGVAAVFYADSVRVGTNPDVPVPDSVRVVLVNGPTARTWFDDYRSKVHAVSLNGLGDEAYYDGYASVSVLKGDAYLRISVIGPRGVSLAGEKQLAAIAAPRI